MIHSKRKTPDEIIAFARAWPGTIPLALVPTAYPDLTEAKARALGKIAIMIYANHAVRAAVTALREDADEIGICRKNATVGPALTSLHGRKSDKLERAEL